MAEPLKATWFAFRKREEKGVLVRASVAYAVLLLFVIAVFVGALVAVLGPTLTWLAKAGAGPAPESIPPGAISRILLILPVEFVFLFVVFIVLAAYEAACLRWMIRGERSAPVPLNLGADTWRVYGTYWCWLLYGLVGEICLVVVTMLAAAAGHLLGATGGFLTFALVCAYLVGWFYVTVRLAPAAASSVGAQHFAPLRAWTVTRGRFWALFGSFLLLGILYLIVAVVLAAPALGVIYGPVFSHLDWRLIRTDPSAFSAAYRRELLASFAHVFTSPGLIAIYVGSQLCALAVGLMFYTLFYGVSARAVQAALEEGKLARPKAA